MKKLFLLTIVSAGFIFTAGSCKKKDKISNVGPNEVEISQPCSEFRSDDEFFRAFGSGQSMDRNVAKQKALSNTRSELAGALSTVIKVVGDNYVKSSTYNNKEELMQRFEENGRTVINQELRGVKTVCERLTQSTDGSKSYNYYIALELSGSELFDKYYQSLTSDESLKIDYNYERFKETFNEEMKNFRN
ncbi:MAG: hypothetical protein JJU02_12905 [Cryomorphaceae bacterium]|nr:hypothetical protein [Cryomorphaceae bacterium]